MKCHPRYIRYISGTTLVEVLVAAIIIGIGLLGIASLLTKSMQASMSAENRATAIDIAWSLADRIRANLKADNDYVKSFSSCPTSANVPTCFAVPGGSPILASSNCSPSNIAAADLEEVYCGNNGIRNRLPGGALTVSCTDIDTTDSDACSEGSQMTITITWDVRNDVFGTGKDRIIMPVIPGAP